MRLNGGGGPVGWEAPASVTLRRVPALGTHRHRHWTSFWGPRCASGEAPFICSVVERLDPRPRQRRHRQISKASSTRILPRDSREEFEIERMGFRELVEPVRFPDGETHPFIGTTTTRGTLWTDERV